MRVIEGYGALPAFGLLNQLQVGDTGPAESTRQGNLQRVGLLFLGSRDNTKQSINEENSSLFMNSILYKGKNEGRNLKSDLKIMPRNLNEIVLS